MTPSPRTSCTLPFASVMIQCRASSRAGLRPSLRMVIVYANTYRVRAGSDSPGMKRVSTSIRIFGPAAGSAVSMPLILSADPHGEHIARCRVQHGVLGEIQKDGGTVALAARDDDEVRLALAR